MGETNTHMIQQNAVTRPTRIRDSFGDRVFMFFVYLLLVVVLLVDLLLAGGRVALEDDATREYVSELTGKVFAPRSNIFRFAKHCAR